MMYASSFYLLFFPFVSICEVLVSVQSDGLHNRAGPVQILIELHVLRLCVCSQSHMIGSLFC